MSEPRTDVQVLIREIGKDHACRLGLGMAGFNPPADFTRTAVAVQEILEGLHTAAERERYQASLKYDAAANELVVTVADPVTQALVVVSIRMSVKDVLRDATVVIEPVKP